MRPRIPRLVALIALLAACSSEPAAPGADAAPDAPAVDAVSAADVVDAPRPTDAHDAAAGGDVVDATASVDAPLADAVEVDAAAVGDAPDVLGVDAAVLDGAADVAAVGDVVDAGPTDAGPTTWPLDPPPGAVEGHVLYQRTCAAMDGGACDSTATDVAMGATCTRTGSRLNFNLRACAGPRGSCVDLTGLFPDYRSSSGATLAIVGSLANQGRNLRIGAGTAAGGRQSFHVQFSAAPTGAVAGAAGIEGRTADPSLGDIWLLGCALR